MLYIPLKVLSISSLIKMELHDFFRIGEISSDELQPNTHACKHTQAAIDCPINLADDLTFS